MQKWKTVLPRSKQFNTQLYVMPVINEDGKQEDILFYANNSRILCQVIDEHNKLVDIFKAQMKKATKNVP
jgi:hypothetical protein